MNEYNQKGVEEATRTLLVAMGYDPDCEALKGTPDRVARAWRELLAGVGERADSVLGTTFDAADYDAVVALKSIEFDSTCEHHLLPFRGTVAVAYLPKQGGRVVGLSKLARLVEMHARRLQLQERMTQSIAEDLERVLEARGVAVIVKAKHLCMCSRGVRKSNAEMVTSTMFGLFRTNPTLRNEVLELLKT